MASRPFRFSLEPRRVAARAERDTTSAELLELERERRRARAALGAALRRQREVAQRLARELDDSFRRPFGASRAREWTWSCQYVEQLRELRVQHENAAQRQREQLALVELKLENKRAELLERQGLVDALERAFERERATHLRQEERAQERQRDDEAPIQWSRSRSESGGSP